MACVGCLDNCDDPISDKCVKYTGADIACLGICTGDTLYEFEVAIAEKICAVADGTGIDLSTTLNCEFLTTLLGTQDKTLANLLQVLADGVCTLRGLIQTLDDTINTPYSFNTSCLSGLGASPTRDEILNAALIKLCSVDARVLAIENDYVKNSELCAKITTCLTGGGGIIQENTKLPKYVALPYHGPLSAFDSQGVGLSAFGYEKVYICNGQTVGSFVTPDYRGRSPIGVNVGLPGGVMDAAVNPGLPANSLYQITNSARQGAYTNTLTISTIPAHNHTVIDPGHTHTFPGQKYSSHPSGGSSSEYRDPAQQTTDSATTGITLASSGGSQPHNNLHPTVGAVFIIYVPS